MSDEFHRVRTHVWVGGRLKFIDHVFPDFDSAMGFAQNYECDNFKIFGSDDSLKHSSNGKPPAASPYA
jgi:hypothetical protein